MEPIICRLCGSEIVDGQPLVEVKTNNGTKLIDRGYLKGQEVLDTQVDAVHLAHLVMS